MARVHYERLSEESLAHLENENSRKRAHTAMTLIFESGPLATKDGGVDFEKIREIVESKLSELPRLRSKLRRVPGDGHQVWVDDAEFNLDYHLRQSSLPRPGNDEQLSRTAARIAATRLDRSRPLWDLWVIEGLEGGRFAFIVKMHKALSVEDGSDLLRTLLSANEQEEDASVRRFRARPAPSPVELFSSEVLRRWSPSRRLLSAGINAMTSPAATSRKIRSQAVGLLKVMGYALRPASESPFDGRLGPHRKYEMAPVSFDALKAIHHSLGGSIHDVVLALIAGSLRRFMEERFVSAVTVDLRAQTPILDFAGKEAQTWNVELPLWEADPAERLRLIRDQTTRLRSLDHVASGSNLTSDTQWNASRLFSIGARALESIDLGTIAILQAPGPQQPLYVQGARLLECYGILPLQDSSALCVTAMSYNGNVFIAFNADPEIVPDLDRLRMALPVELDAMTAAASEKGRTLRAVSA